MEYEKMKEWLDRLVANAKEALELSSFGNDVIVTTVHSRNIQIFQGIEIIADTMGIQLEEKERGDDEYPYKYGFQYQGVCIFQITEERLERFARADREQNGSQLTMETDL